MLLLNKKMMLFVVLALFSVQILAQDQDKTGASTSSVQTTAVPFLLISPDSRAGGIGESGGGLADNANAVFWNPAGAAFLSGSEFSFTHSNWLPQFNLDLFYDYLSFRQYIESIDGSLLGSITFMNYGEFVRTSSQGPDPLGTFRSFDFALTAGYATKVHQDVGLGTNFRLIYSRLSDQPTENEQGKGVASTVSFDIAAMWRPSKLVIPFTDFDLGNKMSIGVNLSNLGPNIYYIDRDQKDPLPTQFRLGFAFNLYEDDYNSFMYTVDFSKLLVSRTKSSSDTTTDEFYTAIFKAWGDQPFDEELRDVVTSTGLEYTYGTPGDFLFALRAGLFYEDPSYGNRKFATLGAGVRYNVIGLDFSYITTSLFKGGKNHPLAETLRFTISIGWGGLVEKTKGLPRGI